MMNFNTLHECLTVMAGLPDGCVDLTVTSPPYDNLRTYNGSLEWGEHVWKPIIKELFRVTKQGGVVVWVVNDATINGSETGTSFKQALWAMECGFNLHDTMIYQKKNFPPLTHNRYEQSFEYMFVFSKRKPVVFNGIEIESQRVSGGARFFERDGSLREHHSVCYMKDKKLKPNIWAFPTGQNRNGHPGTFPYQLAEDHILSWSNEGDTVLDPFAGSGTTAIAAMNTNRKYILIEKDAAYCDIIRRRIAEYHSKPKQMALAI